MSYSPQVSCVSIAFIFREGLRLFYIKLHMFNNRDRWGFYNTTKSIRFQSGWYVYWLGHRVEKKMQFSIFEKVRKLCQNAPIFAKFHKISFLKNFPENKGRYCRKNFRENNCYFRENENFVQKVSNVHMLQYTRRHYITSVSRSGTFWFSNFLIFLTFRRKHNFLISVLFCG
jgi:hypothetical protein